ncbi:MFS transporter [Roseicyclus mahoneyensis]|uniref:Na+/melibiose symporter-like transporter n=1 Tax=Roseicyclus mahoneyensis TaxID=164332 RepID=A0A316GBI8_9RHOB|nr:MFS transporter [Roseicyclus mahoneyensis]PWK57972.1 Na+/melibiose symporter-like transporter [Roseicyclus mahoneyensis]
MTSAPPVWRDGPVLAFMVSETVIWASIFYSFPALVLHWKDEFGWSATAALGAFSLALALQGLAAPWVGRAIDRGLAPWGFALGTLGALAGLAALTQVETLVAFYAVWAWMGLMMGFTLYDACFSVVTRARGAQARAAITAITLAAGFASTLTYPLTAWVIAAAGWRASVWVLAGLVLVFVLPLASYAAHRMEREAQARTPVATAKGPARTRVSARPGYWPLAGGFALTSLGVGIILSNLMPLMAALGVPDVLAILAASTIGPAQVAGRILLIVAGARVAAQRVILGAFLMLATAAVLLGAAAALPALALVFAIAQGVGNGVISILRPVVTREVMGEAGFGESAGAVARLSLFAFALAPGLGAVLADLFGYGAVVALCVAAPLAGAVLLRRLAPTS